MKGLRTEWEGRVEEHFDWIVKEVEMEGGREGGQESRREGGKEQKSVSYSRGVHL